MKITSLDIILIDDDYPLDHESLQVEYFYIEDDGYIEFHLTMSVEVENKIFQGYAISIDGTLDEHDDPNKIKKDVYDLKSKLICTIKAICSILHNN